MLYLCHDLCHISYSCHDTICTTAIASSWHTNVIGRIGSGQDLNSCNTLAMHLKLHKKRNEQSKVYYVQTWVIFQKESFVFSSFPMNWLWTQIFAFFKFRVPTTGSNIIVSINRLNYCKTEASLNTAFQFETSSTDLLYSFQCFVNPTEVKQSSSTKRYSKSTHRPPHGTQLLYNLLEPNHCKWGAVFHIIFPDTKRLFPNLNHLKQWLLLPSFT